MLRHLVACTARLVVNTADAKALLSRGPDEGFCEDAVTLGFARCSVGGRRMPVALLCTGHLAVNIS